MNNNLLKDLDAFCADHNIELKDLIYKLKYSKKEREHTGIIEKVNANKKLVGLCFREKITPKSGMFPEMYRYYKIISERASSEYDVSCLIFNENPIYWFEYKASKIGNAGDYFLGKFEFNPIWVGSISVKSLEHMEQIDEGLFKYELNWLGHKINDIPWIADHYRYGGKLPTDEGWERKDAGAGSS